MKAIVFMVALFSLPVTVSPCGNSYRRSTNTDEYIKGSRLESFKFRQQFDYTFLTDELNKLADAISADLNLFENENDQALTYMRLGKYDKAINILKRLEQEKPDEYNVIANLGTAYELKGENKLALEYILKAVAINSASHHGSEWFHIKILEAKLLNRDPGWWKAHKILNLQGLSKDAETIISDIIYQLKERLPFTKKPNVMMASILAETGDFLLKNKKQQQAWVIFKMAAEYDADNSFKTNESLIKTEKYLSANNLPLPDYKAHFISADNLVEKGKNLLEKGLNIYNNYQEKEKEKIKKKKRQNTLLYIIIAGVAIISGLLIYYGSRKRKAS